MTPMFDEQIMLLSMPIITVWNNERWFSPYVEISGYYIRDEVDFICPRALLISAFACWQITDTVRVTQARRRRLRLLRLFWSYSFRARLPGGQYIHERDDIEIDVDIMRR